MSHYFFQLIFYLILHIWFGLLPNKLIFLILHFDILRGVLRGEVFATSVNLSGNLLPMKSSVVLDLFQAVLKVSLADCLA